MMKLSNLLALITCLLLIAVNVFAAGVEDVTLGGQAQIQYRYIGSDPSTSELFMRRARLALMAKAAEWGRLKLVMSADKGHFTLQDAYFELIPKKDLSLYIGHSYAPFSREALNSSKRLQMVERSLSSEFAPFRQMGTGIHGFNLDKKLEGWAGIYNGAVDTDKLDLANNGIKKVKLYHIDLKQNDNNKFLYAGRIDFHPFGYMKKSQSYLDDQNLFSIGVNAYFSDDSPSEGHTSGEVELKNQSAVGVDAAFKYAGFAGTVEYNQRTIRWWDTSDNVKSADQTTYTLQAGYMVVPKKLELTTRYEFVNYDVLVGPEGQMEDKWISFGLNCFLNEHRTKIQINYVLKDETMPTGKGKPDNNTILMQSTYYF